ncbi:MAG: hypothetical protein J4F41_05150 [Alphaproteobacteria bacterium]|nr:hypothetical protein [Alphaproteobacteria bacterium]
MTTDDHDIIAMLRAAGLSQALIDQTHATATNWRDLLNAIDPASLDPASLDHASLDPDHLKDVFKDHRP